MLSFVKTILKIAVLILFTALTQIDPASAKGFKGTGVITSPRLNVRSGPGIKHDSVMILNRGTKVKVIKKEGEWFKISYKGKSGFVRNRERYLRVKATRGKISSPRKKITTPGRSETIKRQIKSKEKRVKQFTRQESYAVDKLNEIDRDLNRASKDVSTTNEQLRSLEKSIKKIALQERCLKKTIETNRIYAEKRLNALYRISRTGSINLPEKSKSIMDSVKARSAMKFIISNDLTFLRQLEADKKKCLQVKTQLEARQSEKSDLEARLNEEMKIMTGERRKRTELIKKIQEKKSMVLAAIAALEKSARELDKKVTSFKKEKKNNPPMKKQKGNSFSSYKGLLKPPVKGKITSYFGRKRNRNDKTVTFQNGINIKANRGSPIRAVSKGHILFANWFKGYGNMIIIDHGDSYYSIYARAEELFKAKGDTVEKREVIATVGSTASIEGPSLHFEIRHHGKPVDPRKWLTR